MKNLGDVVNTNEVLRELSYQNAEFDLFTFFDKDKNKSADEANGACGFITRKQFFYCFSPKYHSLVFENVGSSIFDDGNINENVYYTSFKKYKPSGREYSEDAWRYANADFGVVSIQLLSKNNLFVWVPNKINNYQKQCIINFCSEMININNYLKKTGFSEVDVLFSVMENGEYGSKLKMNEFLIKINDYVDDNCFCPHENIVLSRVNNMHI